MAQKHSSSVSPGPQSEAALQYCPHVVKLCGDAGCGSVSEMIKVAFGGARGIAPRSSTGHVAGQNCRLSKPQVPAGGVGESRFEGGWGGRICISLCWEPVAPSVMDPSLCWAKDWPATMFQSSEVNISAAWPFFCGTPLQAHRGQQYVRIAAAKKKLGPLKVQSCRGVSSSEKKTVLEIPPPGRSERWQYPPAFAPLRRSRY